MVQIHLLLQRVKIIKINKELKIEEMNYLNVNINPKQDKNYPSDYDQRGLGIFTFKNQGIDKLS